MGLVFVFIGIIFIVSSIIVSAFVNKKEITDKNMTINEKSFQNYAKFYGMMIPVDDEFNKKLNKIYRLIVIENVDDINFIAKDTGCTYEECILKIKYLKNKRAIGEYYIDHINGIVKKCSKDDLALLKKYKPYIYGKNHLQINEIAARMPMTTINNLKEREQEVIKDLKYLYNKDLINGIILDEVDGKITYYSIEKRLKKDTVSIDCENCGAINDVTRGGKTRCGYCGLIIEDKDNEIEEK